MRYLGVKGGSWENKLVTFICLWVCTGVYVLHMSVSINLYRGMTTLLVHKRRAAHLFS